MQNILMEVNNRVCRVSFDIPKTLNALNTETLKELNVILDQIENNDDIDIVVFTGEGKAFIAGADILEMAYMDESQAKKYGEFGSKIFRRIELLKKVTIAAINGYCLGGGLELALSCDLRLASNKAKMGQPEVSLGITPGFSGTQRLPRLVGITKAKELLYTGKIFDANEALQMGLITQISDQAELVADVEKLTNTILQNSQIAIQYIKKVIVEGLEAPIDDAIELENIYFSKCFSTKEQKEGMSAFLEKRKPNFK